MPYHSLTFQVNGRDMRNATHDEAVSTGLLIVAINIFTKIRHGGRGQGNESNASDGSHFHILSRIMF